MSVILERTISSGAPPKRFCPEPFEKVSVDQDGSLYMCCPSLLPVSIGNVLETPWRELWNSAVAHKIRASILDGSFCHCSHENCVVLEGNMLPLASQVEDERYLTMLQHGETTVPVGPRHIEIAYDPSCNLSCPSCRVEKFVARGAVLERARLIDKIVFDEMLVDADTVTIAGFGDPFSSKLYFKRLLEINPTRYPNLKVALITNGLLLTPKLWARLEEAGTSIASIEISIDAAAAATYAKVRRGGDFQQLLESLQFLAEQRRSGSLPRLIARFVVSTDNYAEMPAFVRLANEHGVDTVLFTSVFRWSHHSDPEYIRQAVHLASHPEHMAFLSVLTDPALQQPNVLLGNFRQLLEANSSSDGARIDEVIRPLEQLPLVNVDHLVSVFPRDTALLEQPRREFLDEAEAEPVRILSSAEAAARDKMPLSQQHPRLFTDDDKHAEIRLEKAVAIVQSYSKALELKSGAGDHEVLNLSKLSHPKQDIKQSLLLVLESSADPTDRKMLSAALVLLADFQPSDAATVKDIVNLERLGLIEELEQAGYEWPPS